jgi:hypothetical protein
LLRISEAAKNDRGVIVLKSVYHPSRGREPRRDHMEVVLVTTRRDDVTQFEAAVQRDAIGEVTLTRPPFELNPRFWYGGTSFVHDSPSNTNQAVTARQKQRATTTTPAPEIPADLITENRVPIKVFAA